MPLDVTRRALVAALLTGGAVVVALRAPARPPGGGAAGAFQLRELPPKLHAARTEAGMQVAVAPYVRVGRPLAETTDTLEAIGFRCDRAAIAGRPDMVGPMICSYHLPGDDPRAWDVVLSTRGDAVFAYAVSQPVFLERYGREVLARERAGRPMPSIADFVPVPAPPGGPAPRGARGTSGA